MRTPPRTYQLPDVYGGTGDIPNAVGFINSYYGHPDPDALVCNLQADTLREVVKILMAERSGDIVPYVVPWAPEFRFTPMSDPYAFDVNGSYSVHDFAHDPDFGCDALSAWGVHVPGRVDGSGWMTGYETREAAALAGWQEICRMADG